MASIIITDLPRTTTKPAYRAIWRIYRIAAKKALKASIQAMSDMMIYGQSIVKHQDGELININPKDFYKCQA